MKIISNSIKKDIVLKKHNHFFKTMIKAVVDIEKEIMAVDAELHADLENMLLCEHSTQEHLWGINLYLEKTREDWIEYTALINIRPSMGNKSMEVSDPQIQKKIAETVYKLITE